MWYLALISDLEKKGCKIAVAGGFAVALHGAIRGTVDLDLCVALTLENLTAVETTLKARGFLSRIPVTAKEIFSFRKEYISRRNLVAWSFSNPQNPLQVVDILVLESLRSTQVIRFKIAGVSVPVLKLEALIKMKKKAGRPQDKEDVLALERIHKELK